MKIKRVYVAGPYSSDNVITMLNNIRDGMRAGVEVLLAGFSPWVPWHDFHHQLMLRDGEQLSVDDYYQYSLSWLEVSDAILMLPGWEKSRGSVAERNHAKELGIPVFYSISQLKAANGK